MALEGNLKDFSLAEMFRLLVSGAKSGTLHVTRADGEGVVCFKGIGHPPPAHTHMVNGNSRCLRYGTFAVYGDDEMLREVRDILAGEGFRLAPDP